LTVAQRMLGHEHDATAGIRNGYGRGGEDGDDGGQLDFVRPARECSLSNDPAASKLAAKDMVRDAVSRQFKSRPSAGMRGGKLEVKSGSLLKLGISVCAPLNTEAGLTSTGADRVLWAETEEVAGLGPGGCIIGVRR
jgi:hypothetical protein